MLSLVKVAVTGGLACGKSTACGFFSELGAAVVSADTIAHRLLSPNTILGQKVINLIGPDVILNQQIDRSQIAKKVFDHPKLLKALEEILHPAIYQEIEEEVKRASKAEAELFVAEVPLLFETGGEKYFDYTIAVVAHPEISQERFYRKSGYGKDEYTKRVAHQMDLKIKINKADFMIQNNGSLEEMREAVKHIYQSLKPGA